MAILEPEKASRAPISASGGRPIGPEERRVPKAVATSGALMINDLSAGAARGDGLMMCSKVASAVSARR